MSSVRRVVLKIGTGILLEHPGGENAFLESLAKQVADLKSKKIEVLIVSSGAVGLGMRRMGQENRPASMAAQQALASVGQKILMNRYDQAFSSVQLEVAQVLLTYDDLKERGRYNNVLDTMEALLENSEVVPVINENDAVSVDELRYGDNDTLAAWVANLTGADLLVLLSDIPGFYEDAKLEGQFLSVVTEITSEMKDAAGETSREDATGGMATKLGAADIVTKAGVSAVIADGRDPAILGDIMAGKDLGTYFVPRSDSMASRKRWIALTLKVQGCLVVDKGALEAIEAKGSSLLPSGIVDVEGDWTVGAAVSLRLDGGAEFARGRANYSGKEVRKIKGHHSKEINTILGTQGPNEVVHRDDMVLL